MLNELLLSAPTGAPERRFGAALYTGTGSARLLTTGVNLVSGGAVWTKQRNTTEDHMLFDSVRGYSKRSRTGHPPEDTFAAVTPAGLDLLFSSANANESGQAYVAWLFRHQPGFFNSFVFTVDGSGAATVPHGFGAVPGAILFLRRTGPNLSGSNPTPEFDHCLVTHRLGGGTMNLADGNVATGSTARVSLLDGTNVQVQGFSASGTYVAYVFGHDSDRVVCGTFAGEVPTSDDTTEQVVPLAFAPSWILVFRVLAGVGKAVVVDVARPNKVLYIERSNSLIEETYSSAGVKARLNGATLVVRNAGFANLAGDDGNTSYIAIR